MMQSFSELVASYADGSAILRRAVAGMTREQLVARPIAGKWSTLECVAHLADFEPILAERMKRVLTHDHPLLMVANEDYFAAGLIYQERDLEEELAIVETTRKQMLRILKQLPPEAGSRVGVHSYKGQVTLEAVLRAAVNHIPHHVKFIEDKRAALGLK